MTNQPILVLGGTGKTGRRLIERLNSLGVPLRVGSRNAPIPFDWQQPSTWAAALEGTRAVYISYYPDLAVPGAVASIERLVKLALRLGVRRLVLLSGRGEEEAQRAERVLQESGADWTILRASWFFQNFSESFLNNAILSGKVALPVGDVQEPFVDADDIADVALAALTEEGHSERLYELTGPRLLDFDEAVRTISVATGRPIERTRISPDEYAQGMGELGLPADMTELVSYLFSTVLDGRNGRLADGVRQALGREARDFEDYAQTAAKAGAWKEQA